MRIRTSLVRLTAAAVLMLGSANASEVVPAAKVDSGLGDLPPYSEWRHHPDLARFVVEDRVAGEKVDGGLGELPAYREWRSHPELARFVVEDRVVGEKLDSGLGVLPRFSEWKNYPGLSRLAASMQRPAWGPVALDAR